MQSHQTPDKKNCLNAQLKKWVSFLILLAGFSISAQSPFWHWQRALSGTGQELSKSVATDPAGNVIITGYFSSPSLTVGNFTLTNKGQNDVFIIKYDMLGTVLWAKTFGDSLSEEGNSVFADASGNIYLTGSYASFSVSFISDTVYNTNQSREMFVAKLSSSGNVLWVGNSKGKKDEAGRAIVSNTLGEVFVAGNFKSDTLVYGTNTLVNGAPGANTNDFFLLKYDSVGTVLWARNGKGAAADELTGMAIDASGNVAVCGTFTSSTLTIGSATLTNSGPATNVFVAKYNTSGTATWARSEGGTSDEQGNAVACESNGNVILTGNFTGTMLVSGNNTLTATNPNLQYSYLIKYNPIGVVVWTRQLSGNTISCNGVCCDAQGYVTVAGSYGGSLAVSQLTANGTFAEEAFVAKFFASSSPYWLRTMAGNSDDRCQSVATEANGNILITGISSSPGLAFGNSTLTLSNPSTWESFVARLGVNPLGVEENTLFSNLSIYPNPSDGRFYLNASEDAEFSVINGLGQFIHHGTIKEGSAEIDLRGRESGIYFIRIANREGTRTAKLIVR